MVIDKPPGVETGLLVETEWLTAHLDDSNVPVLDCTVAGSVRAEQ